MKTLYVIRLKHNKNAYVHLIGGNAIKLLPSMLGAAGWTNKQEAIDFIDNLPNSAQFIVFQCDYPQ